MEHYMEYMGINNKDNHISKNTTLEELEKIFKDILDGNVKAFMLKIMISLKIVENYLVIMM